MSTYINLLLPFLREAGILAIEKQSLINACCKYDGSIVTDVDLAISKMFKELIANNFKDHSILDEERAIKERNTKEILGESECIWTIDPIDGTKAYYHGSDLFAIAIGLYRNLKPIFGVIYLPAKSTIIYAEDGKAYKIFNVFKDNEKKIELVFKKKELNKNSFVHFGVKDVAKYVKDYKFTFFDGYSAYIYASDVFLCVAQAAFLKHNVSMWDIYASLPIADILGIKIYNINNGDILDKINFDYFDENFKAKNIWLICHPSYKDEMFSILK